MPDKRFLPLPGFRDFAPEQCAKRNYFVAICRRVAQRFAFVEYEAPILEEASLYSKKAGEELNSQLFVFNDKGERTVTLRPELTASLARIATAYQREYTKPLKWFEIGSCFRYERPQKGRGREFLQFNADIIGLSDAAADAEVIALNIAVLQEFGFTADDIQVKISNRQYWEYFCQKNQITDIKRLLEIIDKMAKMPAEKLADELATLQLTVGQINDFIEQVDSTISPYTEQVMANLTARGLSDFITLDIKVVRGLSYYTGIVFETFSLQQSLRAVAGGGRYDQLIAAISYSAYDAACVGFAIGDMVLAHCIANHAIAKERQQAWLLEHSSCDCFVIASDTVTQNDILQLVQLLRNQGIKVDYSLQPEKIKKQLQRAGQSGALVQVEIQTTKEKLHITVRNIDKTIQQNFSAIDQTVLSAVLEILANQGGISICHI